MIQYTTEEIEILKKYYPAGGTNEVQKYINRSRDSIRHKAKNLGIRVKPGFGESKIDLSSIIEVRTPEDAYILGLLWADGHIGKGGRNYPITITLVETDFRDIEDLFEKWSIYSLKANCIKTRNSKPAKTAGLSHKKLYTFLLQNDYRDKSTAAPTKILQKIPLKLRNYFVRGWIDGDGCLTRIEVGKSDVTIAGSYNQDWSALQNLCNELRVKTKVFKDEYKNEKKIYKSSKIKITDEKSIRNLLDYVYGGKQFGLSRKKLSYEKFLTYKSRPRGQKSSPYRGVYQKSPGNWTFHLFKKGKRISGGTYTSEIDAALAYNKEAIKLHGEQAVINIIHNSLYENKTTN